ncbi:Spc97 protein [Saccharomycopsis crataegensis]|uniref:Spindle pole body component n=1 Tax=Saccharomycopsis crataegensis TaxID=43959 RepID=A0AAV5QU36_9ASCO|nr:Spc97 protein [Saccharomycopsis crataegensis]
MDAVQLLNRNELPFILSSASTPPILTSDHIKVQGPSLNGADMQLQQALILQDLTYVLLGLEGSYIRYSSTYVQALKEKNSEKGLEALLKGPDYKLSKHLNQSLKDITKEIIKLGRFYTALGFFVKIYDNNYFGQINQSLAGFIRSTLDEFRLNLELIIEKLSARSPGTPQMDGLSAYNILLLSNDLKSRGTDLKLRILYEICHIIFKDSKRRLLHSNDFQNFISGLKSDFIAATRTTETSAAMLDHDNSRLRGNNDLSKNGSSGALDLSTDTSQLSVCKGGVVLKTISQQITKNQGNPEIVQFLGNLFDHVSQNYLSMLNNWLVNGIIDDPFDEFMIKPTSSESSIFNFRSGTILDNITKSSGLNIPGNSSASSGTTGPSPWDSKFSLRRDGLPRQFEDYSLRNKLLLTGTYLNMVKDCGILIPFVDISAHSSTNSFSSIVPTDTHFVQSLSDINLLNIQVEHWYYRANYQLMSLFYHGYDLLGIIQDLRNLLFIHGRSAVSFSSLISHNMPALRSHCRNGQYHLPELQRDFYYYYEDTLLLKFGDLKLESVCIFTELEDILNVKPINPEGIFNTSSYQALKNIVNESIGPRGSNATNSGSSSSTNHVSFEDYLINYLTFDLTLPSPLSLIIDQTEIAKFQIIFRWLAVSSYLINLLEEAYLDLQHTMRVAKTELKSDRKTIEALARLSILNYRYLNLLRSIYTSSQQVIEEHFTISYKGLVDGTPQASFLKSSAGEDHSRSGPINSTIFQHHSQVPLSSYSPSPMNSFVSGGSSPTVQTSFEQTKQIIQDMLDSILLYSRLTDNNYLKLVRGYFKRVVNFRKFSKRIISEITLDDDLASDQGKSVNKRFIGEFSNYYKKFSNEISGYEKKFKETRESLPK